MIVLVPFRLSTELCPPAGNRTQFPRLKVWYIASNVSKEYNKRQDIVNHATTYFLGPLFSYFVATQGSRTLTAGVM